jgi:putative intracellular protease/amidase
MNVDTCTVHSDIEDVEDIKVLAVIGYAFGWSYFELETVFESWGCNFTTTGETEIVQSCVNLQSRPVEVDLLVSDIDSSIITQFDVLIVPSGGHWQGLCNSQAVLDLINLADENELVISGICTGIAPIADAGSILNGTRVTGHGIARFDVIQSGAILDGLKRVIRDGQIITGGPGNGARIGYQNAPHYDLCLEIVRYFLGDSWLHEVSFSDNPDGKLITVSTQSGISLFDDVETLAVEDVRARVYPLTNCSDVRLYHLNTTDVQGEFTGLLTGLEEGQYAVDLEIESLNRTVEILRNVSQFNFTDLEPEDASVPLELLLVVLAVGIVIGVLVIYWIRRGE